MNDIVIFLVTFLVVYLAVFVPLYRMEMRRYHRAMDAEFAEHRKRMDAIRTGKIRK